MFYIFFFYADSLFLHGIKIQIFQKSERNGLISFILKVKVARTLNFSNVLNC